MWYSETSIKNSLVYSDVRNYSGERMDIANEQELLDTLRTVIERAFDYKAERYTPAELADYFRRRELLPTLIYQRMHHALKGRKGTGKTAILKYLSLPVQVHASDLNKTSFIGFYLTFGEDFPPLISFDPQTEGDIALLFGHWFNLYVGKAIVDSLISAIREGFQGIGPTEQTNLITTLWDSFFGIKETPPSSLAQASRVLNDFQRELRMFLSAPSSDKLRLISTYSQNGKYKYKGRITDVADFSAIFEILKDTVNSFSAKSFFISHARKPQAFKPGDEWHPGAKRRPFVFLAKSSGL